MLLCHRTEKNKQFNVAATAGCFTSPLQLLLLSGSKTQPGTWSRKPQRAPLIPCSNPPPLKTSRPLLAEVRGLPEHLIQQAPGPNGWNLLNTIWRTSYYHNVIIKGRKPVPEKCRHAQDWAAALWAIFTSPKLFILSDILPVVADKVEVCVSQASEANTVKALWNNKQLTNFFYIQYIWDIYLKAHKVFVSKPLLDTCTHICLGQSEAHLSQRAFSLWCRWMGSGFTLHKCKVSEPAGLR